jgi:hypothetical protein
MNDSRAGRSIGAALVAEQRDLADKFWTDWADRFKTLPVEQQNVELARLAARQAVAVGQAVITFCPSLDRITWDPSSTTGIDPLDPDGALSFERPFPAFALQDLGGGSFTLWVKTGDGINDWEVAGGGTPTADDHKLATDATDEAGGGADYHLAKHSNVGNVQASLVVVDGKRLVRLDYPPAPTPQVTRVFYLEPSETDNHLVNLCPSVVASLQFAFPTTVAPDTPPTWADAFSLTGKPGLLEWRDGVCYLVIRAKVLNLIGTTHQVAVDLLRYATGGTETRYCSAAASWVGPAEQYLTDTMQVFRFPVPVRFLAGDVTDRLKVRFFALPGQGGSQSSEVLYIETGADGSTVQVADATQIQTLFGETGGGPLEHEATTGRDQPHQHPDTAIDHTIAPATMALGGKLDLGNAETLLVDPAGKELTLMQTPTVDTGKTIFRRLIFTAATKLHNAASPTTGYSPLKLGRGGTPKDVITFGAAHSLAEFTFVPSVGWVLGAMNTT